MLRHKIDTKQQREHIKHKPKKQAKYKKHYCFQEFLQSPKCLIAASAGEKSQQRQKAKARARGLSAPHMQVSFDDGRAIMKDRNGRSYRRRAGESENK